jgi:cell wall-associated NlpC family hydrolase
MLAKAGIAALAAILLLPILIAAGVASGITAIFGGGSPPSATALNDIPASYLALYQEAAGLCPGLDWSILAGIGKIESDHGRSGLPGVHSGHNTKGAEGPMQFLPATFRAYDQPVPEGGQTPASPYDPTDAIYAAARYLCASGARNGRDLPAAIYAYNHSDNYVTEVLNQAAKYRANDIGGTGGPPPSDAAQTAVAFAEKQLGKPYVWGGNGNPGFDCSGLTHAAYTAAGISIPRTADTQFHSGPPLPAGAPLRPGDLVFYGNPHRFIHHVGLYIGHGNMIDAPTFGVPVRIEPYRWRGDDYAGTRRISD